MNSEPNNVDNTENDGQSLIDHFGYLPPVVDEDELVEDLKTVLAGCGAERFFTSSMVEPTHEYFPDSWAPNVEGIRIVTERLMRYAGLTELEPEVEVYTDEEWQVQRRSRAGGYHEGAAALFMGIEGGKAIFACESGNVINPEALVGTMGHEVAHAFRTFHNVTVEDPALEEILTDVTAIYLGFGIFICNSSRIFEKSGSVQGAYAVTRESTRRLGYLPPRAVAFLLGAQAVARGYGNADRRRIQRYLHSDHSEYFGQAFKDLKKNRSALLSEIGVEESRAEELAAKEIRKPEGTPIVVDGISEKAPVLGQEDSSTPTCPQCGREIDYKVKECPHCRATLSLGLNPVVAWIIAIIFIIFILWLTWPR